MLMRKARQIQSTSSSKMTLTKSSQKRLRNEDEESEDVLPSTKRREYFFSSYHHHCSGDSGSDGAGELDQTQVATTSRSHCVGHDTPVGLLPSTSGPPPEGATFLRHPPAQNGADITLALHNTHLDRQPYLPQLSSLPPHHSHSHSHDHDHLREQLQQQGQHVLQPCAVDHPSVVKDAGHVAPQARLGPLPDVVHETSEQYYCRFNRLLRSAHFERLKRVQVIQDGAGQPVAFGGETHK